MTADQELRTEFSLRNSPWLQNLHQNWESLYKHGVLKTFRKGAVIYSPSEPCKTMYYVQSGRVRLSLYNKSGNERTICVIKEGNIFGEIASLDMGSYFLTAETIVESQIYVIPAEDFLRVMNTHPEISRNVVDTLVRKIRMLLMSVEEMTFKDTYSRIAGTLYRLSREHGVQTPRGRRLTLKFTHQEMANITGSCRVTVSNIIKSFEKLGIIDKENGYVVILDEEKLLEWVDTEE